MPLLQAGAIGLAAVLAALTLLWIVSVIVSDVSIADIAWGLGFVLLAWLYRDLLDSDGSRSLLVAGLITLWGVRLSAHIGWRKRGRSEDPRYAAMRARRGRSFWWRSLFVVFLLQGVLLWFVGLPLLLVAAPPEAPLFTALDAVGLLAFGVGFAFESLGDYQLVRFKADPANRGRVLDRGLWRYSRHPNYFGDALVWWGIYLLVASAGAGAYAVLSPVVMTFLLVRVSGVTLLEAGLRESKPAFADYVARTPAFVPWFPRGTR